MNIKSQLRIDPQFKSLIPPLTNEEYHQLEQNVLTDGIREPLCIWNDTIVDGHNRHEIAQKHNLTFETVEMDFRSERDAVIWILKNQLGRRNLIDYNRSTIALALKTLVMQTAKKNQGKRNDLTSVRNLTNVDTQKGSQISDNLKVDTKKELAVMAGVSHDTINKVENIEEKAIEPVKELAKSGDISINKASQIAKLPPVTQEKVLPYVKEGAKVETALYQVNKDETDKKPLQVEILNVPEYVKEKVEEKAKEFDAKVDLGKKTYNLLSKIVTSAIYYHPTAENMDAMYLLYNDFVPLDDQIKKIDEIVKKLQFTKSALLIRKGIKK